MADQISTIKELAYHIKRMKEEGNSTALLIGAGVSVTAGVPLANDIIEELIIKYEGYDLQKYRGKPNAYNEVMKALTVHQREDFFREKIKGAKVNLAHFFIGSLVSNGFVDCILTTNFDPLLVKTLALFNIYPSVYDLANTKKFLPNSISYPNLFYLHGQGTAFRMLNTDSETKESTEYFTRLFDNLDKKHSWVIVGYSGETDYIFQGLKDQSEFYNNLYWISRKKEPALHIKNELCCKDSVRYIQSPSADNFFRDLNNELNIPLPTFIDKPFSYLKGVLENIGDLKYDEGKEQINVGFLEQTYLKIENAINTIETDEVKGLNSSEIQKIEGGDLEQKVSELLTLGKYEEIIKKRDEILDSESGNAKEDLVWAYIQEAAVLLRSGEYTMGGNLFNEALKLKPNFYVVWYNWGTILGELAVSNNDDGLFVQAFEKLEKAREVDKTNENTLYNLAYYMDFLGKKKGEMSLLERANEYHLELVKINSNSAQIWGNLGLNTLYRAILKNKDEALLKEAIKQFELSNSYTPHFSSYNIACSYSLLNNQQLAIKYLEEALKNKTSKMTRAKIETDSDLDNIKGLEKFKELLDLYKKK